MANPKAASAAAKVSIKTVNNWPFKLKFNKEINIKLRLILNNNISRLKNNINMFFFKTIKPISPIINNA